MFPRIFDAKRSSVVVLLWFCLTFAAMASTNHHVILITIDGLAAYYLGDAKAAIPTFRRLAAEGAAAEGMRVCNPSITWPNHTTLVTGVRPAKHSVLFNGLLTRPGVGKAVRVEPASEMSALVAVPTLFDMLHQAGYRTAGINWPCTRAAVALDDNFPDVPDQIAHTTPRLREELIAARILEGTNDSSFRGLSAPLKDQIWTAAAIHVLRERRPHFMAFHL